MYRVSEVQLIKDCFSDFLQEQREKIKYLLDNEGLPDLPDEPKSENLAVETTRSKYFETDLYAINDEPVPPFRPNILRKKPPLILKLRKQKHPVKIIRMKKCETEEEVPTRWMVLKSLDKEKQEKKK